MYNKKEIKALIETLVNDHKKPIGDDALKGLMDVVTTSHPMNVHQAAGWKSYMKKLSLKLHKEAHAKRMEELVEGGALDSDAKWEQAAKEDLKQDTEAIMSATRSIWKQSNHLFHFTRQITDLGAYMDCWKCGSTGWTQHMPEQGRCYWCNRGGQHREPGKHVMVTAPACRWFTVRLKQLEAKFARFQTNTLLPQEVKDHLKKREEELYKERGRVNEIGWQ